MITYESLRRHPAAFRSLTGYTVEHFDALFAASSPTHSQRHHQATTNRKEGTPRKRSLGWRLR
jgi:hypothetical protein